MYIDFKPSQIIKIMDSDHFFEFTAIVNPVSREKYGIGTDTFTSKKNIIIDYSVAAINTPVFLRCCMHKESNISVMDFKDYEINASVKENPYVCQHEKVDPEMLKVSEIIENIVAGYPTRMRGHVIRNTFTQPADGIDFPVPIITVDVNFVDFFKRDASLEGLSNKELIDTFEKKQEEFLSEKRKEKFNGK